MRSDTTISRESMLGMVVVSWMTILLLGGVWATYRVLNFMEYSEDIREEYYASQKELVRERVEDSVEAVEELRRDWLDDLWQQAHARVDQVEVIALALGKEGANLSLARMLNIWEKTVRQEVSHGTYWGYRGDTLLLIDPIPRSLVEEEVMAELFETLSLLDEGERQIAFPLPGSGEVCTFVTVSRKIGNSNKRVVSAGCVEERDIALQRFVSERFESLSFGDGGYVFGGTWKGIATLGPAKGRDMWDITDVNGVPIVQELVAAAKRGGGYVAYVMPAIEGRPNTDKISYALPIPDWKWYVGVGVYVDDIEAVIDQKRDALWRDLLYHLGAVFTLLVAASYISLLISRRLARKVSAHVANFTEEWKAASAFGEDVDATHLRYREFKGLAEAANRMTRHRKQAEGGLFENEQRFRMLVSNIPGLVFRCTMQDGWVFEYVSEASYDMTGFLASDLIGKERSVLSSIVDPRDRDWLSRTIQDEVGVRQPYLLEYRINRLDGRKRWFMERGQAHFNENGDPVWLDGVIFDVTDKKQTEEEYYSHMHFLETMERLDSALRMDLELNEVLSEAVEVVRISFGADRCWLLTPCDPSAAAFIVPIERSTPEYPGAGASEARVPMDDDVKLVLAAALESDDPLQYDESIGRPVPTRSAKEYSVKSQLVFALRLRSGESWLMGLHQCTQSRMWNDDEMRLFKEAGRRIADTLGNMLIYKRLERNEERFRTVTEQSMLGICVVQDHKVFFANKAFADIFELSVDELLNLPPMGFIRFVHPDDRAFLENQARKKQAGDPDVVENYMWRAITSTGRVRWVEIHSRSVPFNGRSADLISLMDVTDRQRSTKDLERLVADRTKDLITQAEELEAANVELRRLDELKSSILNSVSHDLRTPMTSVLGYAKLVRKDVERTLAEACHGATLTGRIKGNLDIIEEEGARLTRIVDGFMELAALQAGTAVWEDMSVPIEQCILRSIRKAENKAASNEELRVVLHVEGALPDMVIDPDRFEQVVDAILDNAVKYTRKGEVALNASCPNDVLTLTVSDTGKGMPEGELNAVFNPFHQVMLGDTLSDGVKGSGLGLSISKAIVEHYGGTIHATSHLGKGSSFTVEIPVRS